MKGTDSSIAQGSSAPKLIASFLREADAAGFEAPSRRSSRGIVTPCPSCGSASLFIGTGGHLTCGVLGCKDLSPEHAVQVLRAQITEGNGKLLEREARIRAFSDEFQLRGMEIKEAQRERDALVRVVTMLVEKLADKHTRNRGEMLKASHDEVPF